MNSRGRSMFSGWILRAFYAAEDRLSSGMPPTLHTGRLQVHCDGRVSFFAMAEKREPSVREWKRHIEFLGLDGIGVVYERRRVIMDRLNNALPVFPVPTEFAFGSEAARAGEAGNTLFYSKDDSWIDQNRLLAVKVITVDASPFASAIYRLRLTEADQEAVRIFKSMHCTD